MNLAELWAEIEEEQSWRFDELRFFQNQISNLKNEDQKKIFRKSLVLLLYSHFEGFCKFALNLYVSAVNAENLDCGQVNYAISAASLSEIFKALRNADSKCVVFKRSLPDDAKLHSFAREREFLENLSLFEKHKVVIPDEVVDMESNLKPSILRKNLFKLGFPHDKFAHFESQINKLLRIRNDVAHGAFVGGIDSRLYSDLRTDVDFVVKEIKTDVMMALKNQEFLRPALTP